MSPARDDETIAALLVIALEYGGVPFQDVISRIDVALTERLEPTPWLATASLARSQDDLVAVLREVAGDHAVLRDAFAILDVLSGIRERRRLSIERVVAFILRCYYDRQLPAELDALAGNVYEDGFCAHAYDAVQPDRADRAVAAFLAAVRGRSQASAAISRMGRDGWV